MNPSEPPEHRKTKTSFPKIEGSKYVKPDIKGVDIKKVEGEIKKEEPKPIKKPEIAKPKPKVVKVNVKVPEPPKKVSEIKKPPEKKLPPEETPSVYGIEIAGREIMPPPKKGEGTVVIEPKGTHIKGISVKKYKEKVVEPKVKEVEKVIHEVEKYPAESKFEVNGREMTREEIIREYQGYREGLTSIYTELSKYEGKGYKIEETEEGLKLRLEKSEISEIQPKQPFEEEVEQITSKEGKSLLGTFAWSLATSPYRWVASKIKGERFDFFEKTPKRLEKPMEEVGISQYVLSSNIAGFGAGIVNLPNVVTEITIGKPIYKPPKFAQRHYISEWDYAFEPIGLAPKGSSKAFSKLMKTAPVGTVAGTIGAEVAITALTWGVGKGVKAGAGKISKAVKVRRLTSKAYPRQLQKVSPRYKIEANIYRRGLKEEFKNVAKVKLPKEVPTGGYRVKPELKIYEGVTETGEHIRGLKFYEASLEVYKPGRKALLPKSLLESGGEEVGRYYIREPEISKMVGYTRKAKVILPDEVIGKPRYTEAAYLVGKHKFVPSRKIFFTREISSGQVGKILRRSYVYTERGLDITDILKIGGEGRVKPPSPSVPLRFGTETTGRTVTVGGERGAMELLTKATEEATTKTLQKGATRGVVAFAPRSVSEIALSVTTPIVRGFQPKGVKEITKPGKTTFISQPASFGTEVIKPTHVSPQLVTLQEEALIPKTKHYRPSLFKPENIVGEIPKQIEPRFFTPQRIEIPKILLPNIPITYQPIIQYPFIHEINIPDRIQDINYKKIVEVKEEEVEEAVRPPSPVPRRKRTIIKRFPQEFEINFPKIRRFYPTDFEEKQKEMFRETHYQINNILRVFGAPVPKRRSSKKRKNRR